MDAYHVFVFALSLLSALCVIASTAHATRATCRAFNDELCHLIFNIAICICTISVLFTLFLQLPGYAHGVAPAHTGLCRFTGFALPFAVMGGACWCLSIQVSIG